MILRKAQHADAATVLQQRLHQDGIRSNVAELSATKTAGTIRCARHSICLIDAASGQEFANALCDRFDLMWIDPCSYTGSLSGNICSSYRMLLQNLASFRAGLPISASLLRRNTWISYEAIAGHFTDVWFDTIPGEAIETFLEHVPLGARILDAGCGPGHHARFFKKAGFDPVGVDFSPSMLAIAAAKNYNIHFEHCDILSTPLPLAHFDGVWSAVLLNHIPAEEMPIALKNLVATLSHRGFIGLNFQISRPSEIVSCGSDQRFFEYPADEKWIMNFLKALGVRIVATHFGTTTRNTHGLPLEMRFATVVGQKMELHDAIR